MLPLNEKDVTFYYFQELFIKLEMAIFSHLLNYFEELSANPVKQKKRGFAGGYLQPTTRYC